jgi:hypothetical protein
MASYVRAREARIVAHPTTGMPFVPDRSKPYRSDDPLVKAYPDLFAADSDLDVEQATNAPGERRTVRRKRTDSTDASAETDAGE